MSVVGASVFGRVVSDLNDFLVGDKIRLQIRTIERGISEHFGTITKVDDNYSITYDVARTNGLSLESARLNLQAVGRYPFGVIGIEVL